MAEATKHGTAHLNELCEKLGRLPDWMVSIFSLKILKKRLSQSNRQVTDEEWLWQTGHHKRLRAQQPLKLDWLLPLWGTVPGLSEPPAFQEKTSLDFYMKFSNF